MYKKMIAFCVVVLLMAFNVILSACNPFVEPAINSSSSTGYHWPEVLVKAQEETKTIEDEVVLETVRAERSRDGGFRFYIVFLKPSGEEITVKAYEAPFLEIEDGTGFQRTPPSVQELQLRSLIVDKITIGPDDVLRIGEDFQEFIAAQGELTLPVTPTLFVGSSVQETYGSPAIWVFDVVNEKMRGFFVVDALNGSILREETQQR
jgi:hypothetical protein